MQFVKPSKLHEGDRVAVLSPSKGLANKFPHIYELGVRNLEEKFGLKVKEYPTTRASTDYLYNNPKKRAEDVNRAFADEEIRAIVATIGGDESVRILRYLNAEVIEDSPKMLIGFSDITTLLAYYNQRGLITFHGPMIMAGFSQLNSLPSTYTSHIKEMLFDPKSGYEYKPYGMWSDGYPDWSKKENLGRVKTPNKDSGWHWLQGDSSVKGELFGGCIEVLEFLKGTDYWPQSDFWKKKILFLETSEAKPSPTNVEWMLRNYGMQGVFDKVEGLLLGRARDYTEQEKKQLDEIVVRIASKEFDRADLPIVSNMDFGHTDPQFILPLGLKAGLDSRKQRFRLLESPLR